jgi:hypothetical protein
MNEAYLKDSFSLTDAGLLHDNTGKSENIAVRKKTALLNEILLFFKSISSALSLFFQVK